MHAQERADLLLHRLSRKPAISRRRLNRVCGLGILWCYTCIVARLHTSCYLWVGMQHTMVLVSCVGAPETRRGIAARSGVWR